MPSSILLVPPQPADPADDLGERLQDDAWTVLVARSEGLAVETIRTTPVALLIVDSDIWEKPTIRDLVSREAPNLPVIVLIRGDEPSEALVKHLKLGAASFIPRRASSRELRTTIRSVIDLTARNPYRERVRRFVRAGQIEMRLDNDPANVGAAVGFLQNLMDGYDVCDERTRLCLGTALSEALSNAMIHGNLEVDSDIRAKDVDAYFSSIERRRGESPYAQREVTVIARVVPGTLTFVIRDEGPGFSPDTLPDPTHPDHLHRLSGRGILMMRAYADSVTWNQRGNEVTLMKNLGDPARA